MHGFQWRQATPSKGREGRFEGLRESLNRLARAAKGMETLSKALEKLSKALATVSMALEKPSVWFAKEKTHGSKL